MTCWRPARHLSAVAAAAALLSSLLGCPALPGGEPGQSDGGAIDLCSLSTLVSGSVDADIAWSKDQLECFGDEDPNLDYQLRLWFIKNSNEIFVYSVGAVEQTGTFEAFVAMTLYGSEYSGADSRCTVTIDTYRARGEIEGRPTYEVTGSAQCPDPLVDIWGFGEIQADTIHFGSYFLDEDLGA